MEVFQKDGSVQKSWVFGEKTVTRNGVCSVSKKSITWLCYFFKNKPENKLLMNNCDISLHLYDDY